MVAHFAQGLYLLAEGLDEMGLDRLQLEDLQSHLATGLDLRGPVNRRESSATDLGEIGIARYDLGRPDRRPSPASEHQDATYSSSSGPEGRRGLDPTDMSARALARRSRWPWMRWSRSRWVVQASSALAPSGGSLVEHTAWSASDPTCWTGSTTSGPKQPPASPATSELVEPAAVRIPAWLRPSSSSSQAPTASAAGSGDARRDRRRHERRPAANPGPDGQHQENDGDEDQQTEQPNRHVI